MTSALGLARSKYRNRTHRTGEWLVVSGASGLTTSYATGITCASHEVALIDKVTFVGLTNDAATNMTITLEVNGTEIPFHFAGKADSRRSGKKTWKTNGNLVVHPSKTLRAKASANTASSIAIHYRKMTLVKAMEAGLLSEGTLPKVASSETLTGSGLSAGTAKKIVNAIFYNVAFDGGDSADFSVGETLTFGGGGTARLEEYTINGAIGTIKFEMLSGNVPADDESITGGTSSATADVNGTPASENRIIQILGFAWTGHNYNAAEDTSRLGFWDGSGTFGSNGNRVFTVFAANADNRFAPEILIGDTQGCIQGTSGSSLYMDASTNLAGTTPTGNYCVIYRYIRQTDVHSTTGAVGANTGGKRFWIFTDADLGSAGQPVRFFGTSMPSTNVRILGQAGSFTSVNEVAFANTAMLTIGTTDSSLTISETMVLQSDAAGTPAIASSSFYDQEFDVVVSTVVAPGFGGTNITASGVSRSHLVWGYLGDGLMTGGINVTRI